MSALLGLQGPLAIRSQVTGGDEQTALWFVYVFTQLGVTTADLIFAGDLCCTLACGLFLLPSSRAPVKKLGTS